MKLDKETVIKHRFWFLLGIVVPLVLVVLCVLKFGVAPEVQAKEKEFKDAKTNVSGITNPKNDVFIKLVKDKETTLQSKKNKVWEQAWKGQGEVISWPPEMQRELGDKYFGEPIDEIERRRYARLYTES